jgi:hypothetical protein
MNENAQNEVVEKYKSTLSGVFVQIFLTVFVIIAGWLLAQKTDFKIIESLSNVLLILIIILALTVFVLRSYLFSWKKISQEYEGKGKNSTLKMLHNKTLLLGIIIVIISATGFIIAIMEGNKFQMLRVGVIALILFIIIFPRKNVWENIFRKLENHK